MTSIVALAHVHVVGVEHNVYISMSLPDRNLHVFKYDEDRSVCEYEVFSCQSEASDWIQQKIRPNPKHY